MKNGDYNLVIAPDGYPGKKYRGKYCLEHHLVYWQTYGIVPNKDEVVHHKDGNKRHNEPDNLELLARKTHSQEHTLTRGRTMVELKCPICGEMFVREKRQTYLQKNNTNYTCCSRRCAGKFTHLTEQEKEFKASDMFIREFRENEQSNFALTA